MPMLGTRGDPHSVWVLDKKFCLMDSLTRSQYLSVGKTSGSANFTVGCVSSQLAKQSEAPLNPRP